MQDVVVVNEGLWHCQRSGLSYPRKESGENKPDHEKTRKEVPYHEQGPDSIVDEDGSCCDEHAEAYETVELGSS